MMHQGNGHATAHGNGVLQAPAGRRVLFEPRAIPALRLVASPRVPRRIARVLLVLLALALVMILTLPWQQNVRGKGQVVAFNPLERRQVVQANIKGRVYRWGEGIREGAQVTKGQVVLELRDMDEFALERLQLQIANSRSKVEASRKIEEVSRIALISVEEAQKMAVEAAKQEVEMAKQKLLAEQQGLIAARADALQKTLLWERTKKLAAPGLSAQQEVEIAANAAQQSDAKVKQAESYVAEARFGLESKEFQLTQKQQEASVYVQKAKAELEKAIGEVAIAEKELVKAQSDYAKQQNQLVVAPRDGTVVNLLANEIGEIVKPGDPLFTLVPETADRAVEIWVSGNDAPLISPGRHVRLQFEGWPAVQFAGWPSVAVGTFGGKVAIVDAIDNGKGQFRVLVVPDKGSPRDRDWPSERFLRQGVRTNGWVMLNQVSLGYEVWRQLNGFPPVIAQDEPKDAKGEKPPKVKM